MCGRKTLTADMQSIIEELAIQDWEDPDNYTPSYNIAPTQVSPILLDNGKRIVRPMRWGLIPSWAKDTKFAARMINARSETLLEKPAFRSLVPRKRCVVITDGYYEWHKVGSAKQPYFIHNREGRLLPMAGLWDSWIDGEGKPVLSYTVITTTPRSDLAFIHDRMPVILDRDNIDSWLQTKNSPVQEVMPLLKPFGTELEPYPVSTLVNSPRNNSPDCLNRLD